MLVFKVMKNVRLFWLVGIVLLLAGQSLYAQSKKEKKEQKVNEVKELIDSKRFTVDVDRAIPMGGRSVNLTSPYSLEMRGDSVISYLPYFGRAYSAPYVSKDQLPIINVLLIRKEPLKYSFVLEAMMIHLHSVCRYFQMAPRQSM